MLFAPLVGLPLVND